VRALTSTMRPSAGTAPSRSWTSRGGSRKNCRMNSASSRKGSTTAEKNQVTAAAARREPKTNGHPSRAMIDAGTAASALLRPSSFRRSEPCPCALPCRVGGDAVGQFFSAVAEALGGLGLDLVAAGARRTLQLTL